MFLLLISIIILISFIGVSILFYKIIADSVQGKSNWGINLSIPNCPKCGQKVPAIRKPTSTRQAMWGGWTCSNCGCDIDKWGKEINSAKIEINQKQIREAQVNFVDSFDEKGKTPVEKIFEENNK